MSSRFYHYLPVNDEAMKWGIYVTGAGRTVIRPGEASLPRGHPWLYYFEWGRGRILPEFQLILITDGQGTFDSKLTGEVKIQSGSVLMLLPGVWHRYRRDPVTGWTTRWIGFNGEIGHRLLKHRVISPDKLLWTVRNERKLVKSFDRILKNIHANPSQNSILLSIYTMALLAEAIDLDPDKSLSPGGLSNRELDHVGDPLVTRAIETIWTYSHRIISVAQLAGQLSVTRRTLVRHFRAALGRTVLEEINNCRLSRAKRLLKETDLPVKTVAHISGFPTAERMRIAFLQHENISPSGYRRKKEDA
ncbi:MAG: AraC family transcriptional regulator [Pirellulales bacterium]|nr:AraC family transcriptional regulator [Pirellulales bacterium]